MPLTEGVSCGFAPSCDEEGPGTCAVAKRLSNGPTQGINVPTRIAPNNTRTSVIGGIPSKHGRRRHTACGRSRTELSTVRFPHETAGRRPSAAPQAWRRISCYSVQYARCERHVSSLGHTVETHEVVQSIVSLLLGSHARVRGASNLARC